MKDKKFNSLLPSIKQNNNYTTNREIPAPKSKFKSVSKLILTKLDDILELPPNDLRHTSTANSESLSSSINTKSEQKESNKFKEDFNIDLTLQNKNDKVKKIRKKPKKNSAKTQEKQNDKETFMTNVGIVDSKQKQSLPKSTKRREVDQWLKEMKECDEFLGITETTNLPKIHSKSNSSTSSFKPDDDFMKLINEIDSYKSSIKEEMDELQYLIKYVKATDSKVSRHIKGVKNVFEQSGLKTTKAVNYDKQKGDPNKSDSDNNSDDMDINSNGVYDKGKNLDRVRDNLFGIQENVITFYQKFDKNVEIISSKAIGIRTKFTGTDKLNV